MRFGARAGLLLFLLGSVACVAPSEEGVESSDSAQTSGLRVVFYETVSQAFMGGDVGWYDAARRAVITLSYEEPYGSKERSWVERRFEPDSGAWTELSRVPVAAGDPTGGNVDEDYAYAVDDAGARLLRIDATGGVHAYAGGKWSTLDAGGAFPAKKRFSVAYDSGRSRVILYGGDYGGARGAEVWEWDGSWRLVEANGPTTTVPARSLAYDALRKRTVLAVAGQGTWLWDGSSFANASSDAPEGAYGARLVWNPKRRVVTSTAGTKLAEWTGTSWRELPFRDGGFRQDGLAARVSVYDPARERLVETGVGRGTWLTLDYRVTNLTNVAPEIRKSAPQVAYVGDRFSLAAVGRDADGEWQRLTYSYAPVPDGATTRPDGAFLWSPAQGDLGKHTFSVTVSDGEKSASGNMVVDVVEPVSADLLPRGPISDLGATTSASVVEDEHRARGYSASWGGTAVSVRCTLSGDNPSSVSLTCAVSGSIRASLTPGPFSQTANGRVSGDGTAYLSGGERGNTLTLTAKLRANAAGGPELAIDNLRYSKGARFGMLAEEGEVTLTQISGPAVAPVGPTN